MRRCRGARFGRMRSLSRCAAGRKGASVGCAASSRLTPLMQLLALLALHLCARYSVYVESPLWPGHRGGLAAAGVRRCQHPVPAHHQPDLCVKELGAQAGARGTAATAGAAAAGKWTLKRRRFAALALAHGEAKSYDAYIFRTLSSWFSCFALCALLACALSFFRSALPVSAPLEPCCHFIATVQFLQAFQWDCYDEIDVIMTGDQGTLPRQ